MKKLMLLFCAYSLAGCSSVAIMTKETKDGGRVRVEGPGCLTDAGIKKAEAVILKKCPNGYEELERGEEDSSARMGIGLAGSVAAPVRYLEFKCKDTGGRLPTSK